MIFGKSSIPVRVFWDAPDDNASLGVKAEVYAEGTTSGDSLLSTITLTHQSAGINGRYSVLYTPPEGHDFLNIKYLIYTDTGYGTRDLAYGAPSEQLVLNSGVGQLGGGGGVVVRPLRDEEIESIVNGVWKKLPDELVKKKDLKGITDLVKSKSAEMVSQVVKSTETVKGEILNTNNKLKNQLSELSNQVKSTDKPLKDIIEAVKSVGAVVEKSSQVIDKSVKDSAEMFKIRDLQDSLVKSLFFLETLGTLEAKIDTLTNSKKTPQAQDFSDLLNVVEQSNVKVGDSQSKLMKEFLDNKLTQMFTAISQESDKLTVNRLSAIVQDVNGSSQKEVKSAIKEVTDKLTASNKRLEDSIKQTQAIRAEIINTIKANSVALAKVLENRSIDPKNAKLLNQFVQNLR